MKKTIITLSFAALCTLASNAQDKNSKKVKEPANGTQKEAVAPAATSGQSAVNPDGTAAPATEKPAAEKKAEGTAAPKKGGTRMAINEKGMPGNSVKKEEKNPAPAGK